MPGRHRLCWSEAEREVGGRKLTASVSIRCTGYVMSDFWLLLMQFINALTSYTDQWSLSVALLVRFSHVRAVIVDPHVSGLTGNKWAFTLRFLYDEIFCKLTASLGLYCKQMSDERGWLGLGKRRELASREPEQLEKALRSRRSFPEQFGNRDRLLPGLAWHSAAEKGALPEQDWSSVFILDRLTGMMTVGLTLPLCVCVCTCVMVAEVFV